MQDTLPEGRTNEPTDPARARARRQPTNERSWLAGTYLPTFAAVTACQRSRRICEQKCGGPSLYLSIYRIYLSYLSYLSTTSGSSNAAQSLLALPRRAG